MKRNNGFTLIEISIVIVIIGLIAGGILVGRDLIKAAEIRATISQKIKYDAAVNTFKLKYGALPGDINKAEASRFGLFVLNVDVAQGFADGNGLVEGICSGNAYCVIGEVLMFWRHLSEANLIDGVWGAAIDPNTGTSTVDTEWGKSDLFMPTTKFNNKINFRILSLRGAHYFWLTQVNSVELTGESSIGDGMSRFDAFTIDQKIDDGMPNTGSVLAASGRCVWAGNPLFPIDACWTANPTTSDDSCISGGTGHNDPMATYITGPENVASLNRCGLSIKLN